MPVTVSYPGVYIEEIPSGVHTITGVATSIAAFVGWAPQGPTDSAQLVLSFPDFVRLYGGLDSRSLLGYAVSHFFTNGGRQAYIVRLVDSATASPATWTLAATGGNLLLSGRNDGQWADSYGVLLKNLAGSTTRFRLQVVFNPSGASAPAIVESFENLSIASPDPQGRYAVDVINAQSNILSSSVSAPLTAPPVDITAPRMPDVNGNDGNVLSPNTPAGAFETALLPPSLIGGVHFLEKVDLFNLLVVPGEIDPGTLGSLETFCRDQSAFLIADSAQTDTLTTLQNGPNAAITGNDAINAAFYFPWVNAADPLNQNRQTAFPPSGFVAGIYARTDGTRGVWKAPAGIDASLSGATGVSVPLTDNQNGVLNPLAINCIRNFSVYGTILWGARTLRGNDEIGSEWKYIPVRRLALYLEMSLLRGTKWVVFEPNDDPLWAQIRLNVGAFMQTLFRQGAFQGKTPQQAYFVKCDSETTTPTDQNNGIVNILVGFAPLKPAEFVIIQIQQMAGQTAA
jgi:phage tail sheath protein FI